MVKHKSLRAHFGTREARAPRRPSWRWSGIVSVLFLMSSVASGCGGSAFGSDDDNDTGGGVLPGAGNGNATGGNSSAGGGTSSGGATGTRKACVHAGKTYQHGQDLPASDGCNTCSCEDGVVACTLIDCSEPDRRACEDILIEQQVELAEIQNCESDNDCGQALSGTSCGCTRDLVARHDADPSQFYALQAEALDHGCEPSGSTCDCPEADGFLCDAGRCSWNYTSEPSSCSSGSPADVGRLCVRGTATAEGEVVSVGQKLSVNVQPSGCYSSSCTLVQQATCVVSGSGHFAVDAMFCLDSSSSGACTADCGGGGSAACNSSEFLTAGENSVTLGDLKVTFSVPGVLPFGGECDGDPFN